LSDQVDAAPIRPPSTSHQNPIRAAMVLADMRRPQAR
jgi:hypothetical protein